MLTKLDHIGIAVASIDAALPVYLHGLGMELVHREVVATEGVEVAFLPVGETRLELLEPRDSGGAVARFLDKRGAGVHHLCFEVADIDAALARLKQAGTPLVDEVPRLGAEGCRVAFVHPKGTGGVLIELSEKPRAGGDGRGGA